MTSSTWATHSFGSDTILFLILCSILFILHLVLVLLRLLEQIGQRIFLCISKSCKLFEVYIRSRFSIRNTRRRSASTSPPRMLPLQQSSLQCFDRPDCPILSPSSLIANSSTPVIHPSDDLLSSSSNNNNCRNPTPSIPLAPPTPRNRRNPLRRRSSLP